MTRREIVKHSKDFFKINGLALPPRQKDYRQLIDYAEFMISKAKEDIYGLAREAVLEFKRESEKQALKVRINQVWKNRKTGVKKVTSIYDEIEINAHPEDYEFICKAPHADNDYTYECSNPYCKCKQNDMPLHREITVHETE